MTKVETVAGKPIYFDSMSEKFYVGEQRYSSVAEARDSILKDKETEYKGEFLINDSWDGIVEFTAKRKIYDRYDGEWKIVGDTKKTVGNTRKELTEKELFPRSKENLKLLSEAIKMDSDGWALIWAAKRLGAKLQRKSANEVSTK